MNRNRSHRTTWLAIAVGALVVVLAGFAARDKVREQWYLWKLDSSEGHEQRTAIEMLGTLRSAAAVPVLLPLFREQNRARRRFDRDDVYLRKALVAIGEPAIPHLVELTRDRNGSVRSAAWTVLGEVGPAAIPHLLEDFDEVDEEERVRLLEQLRGVSSDDGEVPFELLRASGDPSPRVRGSAISALVAVAPESDVVIETLVNSLEDEDDAVRFAAAVLLARRSDPRAKAALPELVSAVMKTVLRGQGEWRALGRRLTETHRTALSALSHLLATLDLPCPPELVHATRSEIPNVRAAALDALATVAPRSRAAIDALVGALGDENERVRFAAAVHAVELSDPRAKAAIPVLISVISDERSDGFSPGDVQRETAARLLGMRGSTEAVPALIEMLKEKQPQTAIWALGRIGPPASPAIGALSELAKDPGYIGEAAARALATIRGRGR